jgi:N-acetylglucosaminyldiphosphoundecaprenol N-acetyl-beta-D-mannosaminyltransferase
LNVKLVFCLGGSIDVLAGKVKRPPAFMRKAGLEWLGRFIIDPRRIPRSSRLVRFVFAVIKERLFNR